MSLNERHQNEKYIQLMGSMDATLRQRHAEVANMYKLHHLWSYIDELFVVAHTRHKELGDLLPALLEDCFANNGFGEQALSPTLRHVLAESIASHARTMRKRIGWQNRLRRRIFKDMQRYTRGEDLAAQLNELR